MATAATLQVTTPSDREIAMTRVFDAPRHLLFEALTQPELVSRWLLGPPGWTMPLCEIDPRVGGSYRYVWHGPEGRVMGMQGVFREIRPPERLVRTEAFDEAWYAGAALATILLTERAGKTTLTTTVLYESRQVRDGVLKSGMADGVTASYDRLAVLVASNLQLFQREPIGRTAKILR